MKTLNALCLTLMLAVAGPAIAEDELVESYSEAELDQMLAPIALYPDTVLSHVLIAATYPLEIIQAYRWSQDHPDLSGTDAVAAVELQDWDPSVKALVAFPEVLRRMNDDLAWTQRLGEAFLMQEEDVIAAVQGLRERAYTAGNLNSDEHVEVVREDNLIVVESAQPEVIYVPYYDTRVVYGSWHWASYPPVYWSHPPGFHVGINYWWGHGYRITPSWFYISSFHWSRRHVVVINNHHYYKRPRHFRSGRQLARFDGAHRWAHNPRHRRGAGYRAQRLNDRYSAPQRFRNPDRVVHNSGGVRDSRGTRQRQQVDFQRPQRAQRQERQALQVQRRTLQRQNDQQAQLQAPQAERRARQRQNAQQVQHQAPTVQRRERQRDAQQVQHQAPTVQRRERQRDAQQVQREAPRAQRREAPAVQRQAPAVQRQAPAVQRQAPPARRAAPAPRESREAPAREREREQER